MLNVILELYNNLLNIYKEIDKFSFLKSFKKRDIKINFLENNKFFPIEIQYYIKKETNRVISLNLKINYNNFILYFYFDKNSKNFIEEDIKKTILILYLLSLYDIDKYYKTILIEIYLTPFRKFLPKSKNEVIDVKHVNSGLTISRNKQEKIILIYRQEEWFKVLIHELFHALNFDFSLFNINKIREIMKKEFGLNSEYNIYETYCETWARILNVMIITFLKIIKKNNLENKFLKKNFLFNFRKAMEIEKYYSILQASKIINRINNLKSLNDYKENTNVLCYYLFTSALIFNYKTFLNWCKKNNKNLLKFDETNKNVISFYELIIKETNKKYFLEKLKNDIKEKNNRSLRMSIIE